MPPEATHHSKFCKPHTNGRFGQLEKRLNAPDSNIAGNLSVAASLSAIAVSPSNASPL
jgi:hypothetical protein